MVSRINIQAEHRPPGEGSGGGGRAWLSDDNENRVEEGMGVVLGPLGEFHP